MDGAKRHTPVRLAWSRRRSIPPSTCATFRKRLVARPGRPAFFLLDHAATPVAPAGLVPAVAGPVAGALLDVCPAAPGGPPRRPEDEVGEERDESDDDHDPAD